MTSLLVVLGLIFTGLAGCVADGDADGSEADVESEFVSGAATTSATTGAIDGMVVDDTFFPVTNATVLLHQDQRTGEPMDRTATDESGRFVFSLLPPAAYVISVEAEGFEHATTRVAAVAADQVTRIQVVLQDVPSQAPYAEILLFTGMHVCSYATPLSSGRIPLEEDQCPFGQAKMVFAVDVADSWRYGVVEMAWQTSESFLLLTSQHESGGCPINDGLCYGMVLGRSPLRIEAAPEDPAVTKRYSPHEEDEELLYPAEAFPLWIGSGYLGNFREEINATANPVCATIWDTAGIGTEFAKRFGCLGVGYTFGITFDYYVTWFHYEKPENMGVYSAVPDQ